ncbi:MAG: EthD family reductase [Variovorax sp.]|nr:MAG: EthD family reductase [Variovorax sp.]
MEKIIILLRCGEAMQRAAFDAAWQYGLGQLAVRAVGLPGLVRHVRHDVVSEVFRDHMAPGAHGLDAVEELWFADARARDVVLDAWRASRLDLPGAACALAATSWTGFERAPVADPVRRLSMLTRRPDLSREAFTHYWQTVHAPLAACHRFVQAYVQNHVAAVLPLTKDGCELQADGIGDFLIADLDRMQEDYRSEAGIRMKQDVENFVQSARTYIVQTQDTMPDPSS